VHTVGGVVKAGETLMLIVPEADQLIVDARVAPIDIDQLQSGQVARLRFTSYNHSTTPEIAGRLERVSPDVSTDQRTGLSYYTARIAIAESDMIRPEGIKLIPGMPVEAFIETKRRNVLSYLVRPLHDQMARALRE
jgi:HlyD family secretion protein